MSDTVGRLRQKLTKIAGFLLSYGAAKGCAFATPLALAFLLTPTDYGALEFALTAGLLGATLAALGVPQAMPRLILVQGESRSVDVLALAVLAAGTVGLAAAALFWISGAPGQWRLAGLLLVLFAGQLAASFWARIHGRAALTAWLDNGAILLVGVAALPVAAGWALGIAGAGAWLPLGIAGLAMMLLSVALILLLRTHQPGLGAAWRRAAGMGVPMMAGGLLLFAITGAPRLLVGQFAGLEALAVYAFAARINLVLLLGHQILMTAFFARIYQMDAARADRLFSAVLAGLTLVATGLGVAWPWLAGWMPVVVPPLIFALVAVQTILWIASAMLEMLVNRDGLAGPAARWTALVAGLAIGGLYLASTRMSFDLVMLCGVFVAMLTGLVFGQMAVLWRHGVRLPRLMLVIPVAAFALLPGVLA